MADPLHLVAFAESGATERFLRRLPTQRLSGLEISDDAIEFHEATGTRAEAVVIDAESAGRRLAALLTELRRDRRTEHLPCLVVVAEGDAVGELMAYGAGADWVCQGPPPPTSFLAWAGQAVLRFREVQRLQGNLQTIAGEEAQTRAVLDNVLPDFAIEELRSEGRITPRRHEHVAVMFADICGFTAYCAGREASQVVDFLEEVVRCMEEVAHRHQVVKVKTLGDCFMGVAGMDKDLRLPARSVIDCGLEMIQKCKELPEPVSIRVGINAGPLVAGILGTDTWHYDVWGDAVNVAARLQNEIEEGYVGVTAAVWERISGFYIGESLGERFLKGKGAVEVLAISARKPPVTMRFQRPGS